MALREPELAPMLLDSLRGVLEQIATPTEALRTILDQLIRQTSADRGALIEVGHDGRLTHRVLYRLHRDALEGETGRLSRSICRRVARTGKGVLVPNASEDSSFRDEESVRNFRLTSVLCAPIFVAERLTALVYLEARRAGHFEARHLRLLQSLNVIVGPALEAMLAVDRRQQLEEATTCYRQEVDESRALLEREWSFGRFVGRSPAVHALEETIRNAAATEFPVLLVGETGTGKGILARVLHHSGPRADRPFVTLFCPSLEKHMVETELFGHRRGAFTDAVRDRIGKVQAADRGTLFMDEIAELPLPIQPKLLRLLQEKTYERVGDPHELTADVRLIACSNRNMATAVRTGGFRRDLYERVNYLPIRVPPLRERRTDIPLLLRHCLDRLADGRWIELGPDATQALVELDYAWPGNVRQVEQLAARLVARGAGPHVARETLEPALRELTRDAQAVEPSSGDDPTLGDLFGKLHGEERSVLQRALDRHPELTRKQLARRLHISEAALYKKLRRHGLSGDRR